MSTAKQSNNPGHGIETSPTPRERELLALFRVMTEHDRRLLIFTARKMISSKVGQE